MKATKKKTIASYYCNCLKKTFCHTNLKCGQVIKRDSST